MFVSSQILTPQNLTLIQLKLTTETKMSEDKIKLDDMETTLAEISGLSFDDFQEKRGFNFPKGYFLWEVEGGEDAPALKKLGEGDKAKAGVPWKFKCLEVGEVRDEDFKDDPSELIGKFHHQTSFITSADGIGYLKAMVKDIGGTPAGGLKESLAATAGLRFWAFITKRKDPNDTDKVYTQINTQKGKIKPVVGAAQSGVAAAVG
jgi:hypothetical protein